MHEPIFCIGISIIFTKEISWFSIYMYIYIGNRSRGRLEGFIFNSYNTEV